MRLIFIHLYILPSQTTIKGITGAMKINSKYFAREVQDLEILNLQNNKSVQVGFLVN